MESRSHCIIFLWVFLQVWHSPQYLFIEERIFLSLASSWSYPSSWLLVLPNRRDYVDFQKCFTSFCGTHFFFLDSRARRNNSTCSVLTTFANSPLETKWTRRWGKHKIANMVYLLPMRVLFVCVRALEKPNIKKDLPPHFFSVLLIHIIDRQTEQFHF